MQEVTVPPYSEHVLVARIRGEELPRSVTGISCGVKRHSSPLLFGKSLDVNDNNTTHVRFLNTTYRSVIIKRNKNVGQFKCIKSDDQLKSIDLKESINIQPNKTPFKPFEQVHVDEKELTNDDKEALSNLINNYSDVFVGSDGKLGKCDITKHKIELTENTPFRHRANRLNPK